MEVSTPKTKILLDGGVNLEENEQFALPDIQAQYDFADIDAVFLSHFHTDYVTTTRGVLDNVPVYTGKLSGGIMAAAKSYKAQTLPAFAGYFAHGAPIEVGDIRVTPHLVDAAACEGYLLLIEGGGKKVVYTGDYRANGRKSFEDMLDGLPMGVDVLLCEGGVIAKEDINPVTERDIEEQAAKLISGKKGPIFVLQSVTDFDRATTMFRAATRNKRVFLEDLYMAQLAIAAGEAMPNPIGWSGAKAYLAAGYKPDHFRYKLFSELPRVGKTGLGTQKFVMCVRTPMKKYMKTLSQCVRFFNGLLICSPPCGIPQSTADQAFLAFAAEKGLEVATLRGSGHAHAKALKALIEAVKPAKILPLAAHDARWLTGEYPGLPVARGDAVVC